MAHYDPPGKLVLMHNRMGLRIEFSADYEGQLELWISPLAGRSIDYRDRNFSNRDDHTRVFDRVTLPGLSEAAFRGCDYDPFHSVLHFEDQELHLLSHFDEPALVLWTTRAQAVDFKTGADDTILARTGHVFSCMHQSRGKSFHFCACLESGGSVFTHQRLTESGRSQYARANVLPGSVMVLLAGLAEEDVSGRAARLAAISSGEHLRQSGQSTSEALSTGILNLRGRPDWQNLHRICRRHLLSVRDASGAVRAALNRIYYLIWVRDGSMIENNIAASGWSEGAGRWQQFLLANPTVIKDPSCPGRAFLMLVNRITKWEEDGLFYAVWSAFSAWTQWDRAPSPEELQVLEDAVEWLERYCFDQEEGLFGRGFAGESPLFNSHGFGFDDAVGNPCDTVAPTVADGRRITVSYDIYINETAFSVYCMLAAMLPPERAGVYFEKAQQLRKRLAGFSNHGELPSYGRLRLEDGGIHLEEAYGTDPCDYVWALTVPPMASRPELAGRFRSRLLEEAEGRSKGYFLAAWFSLLGSLDTRDHDESRIAKAIDRAVSQSVSPGDKLAMPFAIKEMLDVPDGDRWHDVRPQSFSAAPYLSCLSNLLLRKLPYGLAVRASGVVDWIDSYAYRGILIDVVNRCSDAESGFEFHLNGKAVIHSLQLPEDRLSPANGRRATIELVPAAEPLAHPLLLSSTVRLHKVSAKDNMVRYSVDAFGYNTLDFESPDPMQLEVLRASTGEPVPDLEIHRDAGRAVIVFWGHGRYTIVCKGVA